MSNKNLPFNLLDSETLIKEYSQPGIEKHKTYITNKRVVIVNGDLLKINYSYLSVFLKSIIGVSLVVKNKGFADVYLYTFNGTPLEVKVLDVNSAKDIETTILKLIL